MNRCRFRTGRRDLLWCIRVRRPSSVESIHHQLARHHEVGDRAEPALGQAGLVERAVRACQAIGRERTGAIEAEQRRVGRLPAGGVLARGLAERRGIALDVEDVVDDLKREAEVGGDRSIAATRWSVAPAMIAPLTADARISAPVLRACMPRRPSASRVTAWPGACPAACRSMAWPPTMPSAPAASPTTRRARSLRPTRSNIGDVVRRVARQQREGFRVQAIAGEDGDAFAVDDVQRRPASPQRVVVHRRQVVVDERVGVNQLDGARGGEREIQRCVRDSRRRDACLPRDGRSGERRAPAAAACRRRTRCSAWPR